MEATKTMAILRISAEMFKRLLQLPEDAEIVGVEAPFQNHGEIRVKIQGAGWPVNSFTTIRETKPSVIHHITVDDRAGCLVDWNLRNEKDEEETIWTER